MRKLLKGPFTASLTIDIAFGLMAVTLFLSPLYYLGWAHRQTILLVTLAAIIAAGSVALIYFFRLNTAQQWLISASSKRHSQKNLHFGALLSSLIIRPAEKLRQSAETAQASKKLQEQLAEAMSHVIPDPLLMVDSNNLVHALNSSAIKALDMREKDVPLGLVFRDPGVLAAIQAAMDGGQKTQMVFDSYHGKEQRFRIRIQPATSPEGQKAVLLSMREESEQVLIERIRSDFMTNVSHELKTPLASLSGIIETLQGPAKNDDEARDEFLEIMAGETERMTSLVTDLLTLSRIEEAGNLLPETQVDLYLLLKKIINRFSHVATKKNVKINLQCPSGQPIVKGDREQLEQLFGNLIDNAIKYGRPDGKVDIGVETFLKAPKEAGPVAGRHALYVSVRDDGWGIDQENIERLTERFFRVDKDRSRKIGGTGLGLAIVQSIVDRHQGKLVISSKIGEGSVFKVFLTCSEEKALVTEPS